MQPGKKGVENAETGCKHPFPTDRYGYRGSDEGQKIESSKKDHALDACIDKQGQRKSQDRCQGNIANLLFADRLLVGGNRRWRLSIV